MEDDDVAVGEDDVTAVGEVVVGSGNEISRRQCLKMAARQKRMRLKSEWGGMEVS